MKDNKGFSLIAILSIIVAVLVIIGVAYYMGTKNSSVSQNVPANNYQQQEEGNGSSSQEVFKNQPGAIKSITAQGSNQWILAVDLLSNNPKWFPGVNDRYINQSTKIRDLMVTASTQTYNCDTNERPDILMDTASYVAKLQATIAQAKIDINYRIGGPVQLMTDWVTVNFDVSGDNITAIYSGCLP